MSGKVNPHLWLLIVDDTGDWDPGVVAEVGRIFSIWMYDENTHVYAAELTASYELYYVDYTTESPVDEDTHNYLMSGYDWGEDVQYIHTSSVDRARQTFALRPDLPKEGESMVRFEYAPEDEWPEDWEEPASFMEDAVNALRQNPLW